MSVLSRAAAAPTPAQLGALLDSADQALVLVDHRRRIAYCNPAATRLLGCEPAQGLDRALSRLDESLRGEVCAALSTAGASWQREARLGDGSTLRLSVCDGPGAVRMLRARLDPAGVPAHPPSSAPERRLGAQATSELVRLLWDTPQPLWVQDERFVIVAANAALLQALGRPASQVLGRDPVDFMHDTARADIRLARQALLLALREGGAAPLQQQHCLRDVHGRERWFRFTPRWVSADDGRALLLSILTEVTGEQVARAELDRSVHELEHWFDLSPLGMVVYDQTGLVLRSNLAFESLLGSTPVTLADAAADLRQLLAWEAQSLHAELRADGPILDVWATVRAADGRQPRLHARLRALPSNGAPLRVLAVIEDRSAEDERDLAQLEIGALVDTAGVGVATYEASRGWSRSRGAASATPGAALQSGLQSIRREQVDAASLAEFERLQHALRQGERVQVRYQVLVPDLGRRWLLTRVEPGELTGGRAALSVVTLDITEQEDAHRRSEQLLRERELMFSLSDVGIAHVRDGRVERANDALGELTGMGADGLEGLALSALYEDERTYATLWPQQRAHLQRDGHWRGERRLRRRDGSWLWVQVNKRRVALDDEDAGLICAYVDVDALHQAREALQHIIETAPLAIALFDAASARVLRLNAMASEFFGQPIEAVLGRTPEQWCGEQAAWALRDQLQRALDSAEVLRREYKGPEAPEHPGNERTWDTRIVRIGAATEPQLLLVATDVTEQRAAEQARFDAAVSQREMLIKEVHHRIKNNLQGVAGLLQQGAARRPEIAGLIGEVVGQVQAIAQVHGLQVGLIGPLQIRPLLQAVTGSVQRTFGRPIEIDTAGEPAHRYALPEAEAIPIALTLNELLTNAIKHGAAGDIVCSLHCHADRVSIVVSSPGRLRAGFNLDEVPAGVSGLGLVRALLPRRSASLRLEQCGDTVRAEVRLTRPSFVLSELS